MGGWAEGQACADPGARTPIGASRNFISNEDLKLACDQEQTVQLCSIIRDYHCFPVCQYPHQLLPDEPPRSPVRRPSEISSIFLLLLVTFSTASSIWSPFFLLLQHLCGSFYVYPAKLLSGPHFRQSLNQSWFLLILSRLQFLIFIFQFLSSLSFNLHDLFRQVFQA